LSDDGQIEAHLGGGLDELIALVGEAHQALRPLLCGTGLRDA
jgi:hypothetical protein